MRKRLAITFVTLGALALLPIGAADARTRVHTTKASTSPLCVQQDLPAGLHLQIGLCP